MSEDENAPGRHFLAALGASALAILLTMAMIHHHMTPSAGIPSGTLTLVGATAPR